jgi:hypothetical protein
VSSHAEYCTTQFVVNLLQARTTAALTHVMLFLQGSSDNNQQQQYIPS